jgi:glucose uptake protein
MTVVESYAVAVAMCVVTMICWGSWANTQKLAYAYITTFHGGLLP